MKILRIRASLGLVTRWLPILLVAAVGLGALTGGTLLYLAKRPADLRFSKEQAAAAQDSAASGHVRGDVNAPVTVEEFADLECPPCAALSDPLNQMEKDFRGRVRVVFRHFPMPSHAHAREAALAAEAAALQGRFWPMHDLLYREQAAWSRQAAVGPLFEGYAGTLGLDVARFRRDAASAPVQARVAADAQRGAKLGVSTTPTILVNARPVPAASLRPDRLRGIVEAAVKASASP